MGVDMPKLESVRDDVIEFVLTNFVTDFDRGSLPLDESLVELGVLDSYAVVELVSFLEERWSISIPDADITREKMGSIVKMANLVVAILRRESE